MATHVLVGTTAAVGGILTAKVVSTSPKKTHKKTTIARFTAPDSASMQIASKRRERVAKRREEAAENADDEDVKLPASIFSSLDLELGPKHLALEPATTDGVIACRDSLHSLKLEGAVWDLVAFLARFTSASLEELTIVVTHSEIWNAHARRRAGRKIDDCFEPLLHPTSFSRFSPRLKKLTLDGMVTFPWATLPSTLEYLVVKGHSSNAGPGRGRMSPESADELLSHLHRMPKLRELALLHCLPTMLSDPTTRHIHLVDLEHLELRAPLSAASRFLRCITPSSRATVLIHCDDPSLEPTGFVPGILRGLAPILGAGGHRALASVKLELSGFSSFGHTAESTLTARGWHSEQSDTYDSPGAPFELHLPLNGTIEDIRAHVVRTAQALAAGPALRALSFCSTYGVIQPGDWSTMFSRAQQLNFVHASGPAVNTLICALQDRALLPGLRSLALFGTDFAERVEAHGAFDMTTQRARDVLTRVLSERPMRGLVTRDCTGIPPLQEKQWMDLLQS